MEIQFQKNAIGYLKTLLRQQQKQEQTQQVRLSDSMPDIGRVVGCWGQILVRGKEWRGDSVGVSGGVMAWVLYAAEGDGKPCCVDVWIPFQMKWDMDGSEQDGTMEIHTQLCHIDARMLSDRKLIVRATVGVEMCAMVPSSILLYTPAELPETVQALQRTYPMLLPVEAGEKQFELDASLEIPPDGARIHKLIRYFARPMLTEYKIVADKLVMRGNADVYVLYMDELGKLHRRSWQLPFSQYTQLEGEYDSDSQVSVCFALTQLELEVTQADAIGLKLAFTAQYVIEAQQKLVVTEDMYCPGRELKPEFEALKLPAVLQKKSQTIRAEADTPEGVILDVSFKMDMPKTIRREDAATTELEGLFETLYLDDSGELQSRSQRWENSVADTIGEDADYSVRIVPGFAPEQDMGVATELELASVISSGMPMEQIVAAQLGENIQRDPQRPSLILRRAGTESLWEIAKSTGSTVEAIMKANGLQHEPPAEQMLLIPVS